MNTTDASALTAKDKEVIRSLLGRQPTEAELEWILRANAHRLEFRKMYEILDQLDTAAKRTMDGKLGEWLVQGVDQSDDELHNSECFGTRIQAQFGVLSSSGSEPPSENRFFWRRVSTHPTATYQWIRRQDREDPSPGNYDCLTITRCTPETGEETNRQCFMPSFSLEGLVRWLDSHRIGMELDRLPETDTWTYRGPALITWSKSTPEMDPAGQTPDTLMSGQCIQTTEIRTRDGQLQLPLSVLQFSRESFYHRSAYPSQDRVASPGELELQDERDWKSDLLRLRQVNRQRLPRPEGKTQFLNPVIGSLPLPDGRQWICSIPDNGHLFPVAPEKGGSLLLSNAIRQLTCLGLQAEGVGLHFTLKEGEERPMDALAEDCDAMVRHLGVPILNRTLKHHPSEWGFQCFVHTLVDRELPGISSAFRQDGDFISLLGSHRGELGGSLFLQTIYETTGHTVPATDPQMETRIQEVVLQGIRAGLIQSAKVISGGGLAVAALDSFLESPNGIGIRIHLSRKLRTDELLFGETQGLVMISLKEEDIMEFERICMQFGVPSTTIGRVTDTDQFSFNQLFQVHRSDV